MLTKILQLLKAIFLSFLRLAHRCPIKILKDSLTFQPMEFDRSTKRSGSARWCTARTSSAATTIRIQRELAARRPVSSESTCSRGRELLQRRTSCSTIGGQSCLLVERIPRSWGKCWNLFHWKYCSLRNDKFIVSIEEVRKPNFHFQLFLL